jgi:molybdopterin-guanine dinucleotide biosynthesis protein A
VLAGGASTRFGRDKLAEPYRGAPLLHHAVLRVGEVCPRIVVVLAPSVGEPAMPAGVTVGFVRDPTEAEGPLAGLHEGLLAVRTELALVAAGDMPDLRPPVLREMLDLADEPAVDAVALRDDDRLRPLPCVVRAEPAVNAAHTLLHAGRRALRDLLHSLRLAEIDEETWTALDPERRTLFDVDDPGDLLS